MRRGGAAAAGRPERPCRESGIDPKCIRPPSVLTKRNFISGNGGSCGSATRVSEGIRVAACTESILISILSVAVIAPRDDAKGTVTISVRNEQFQISARRTERAGAYRKLRSAARLCARVQGEGEGR
ncbi:hypothetical protein X777_03469 [Ooceraea biroi]|uniref:Uncharacterized protein n=1 Tax=Ooceraea biroi TaxID=2015173 RepID=A0A026WJC9_OOCBI|nr:hypothetical protein X777_03469 [Ooceraea biroi]